MGLKTDKPMVGHSYNFNLTFNPAELEAEQIVGQRLYGWVGIPIPPVEDFPHYKTWQVQATYLALLVLLYFMHINYYF